jgi:hypothetical protein
MRRALRLWVDLPGFERELPDFGSFDLLFFDFGPRRL